MRGSFQHENFSAGEEIAHARAHGTPRTMVGVGIFGACMVILYTASTLYHALTAEKAKAFFQLMDHAAIYMLIAGTYTPFGVVCLDGVWSWASVGAVWALAILGIVYEVVFKRPWKRLSLAFYLGLGWLLLVPAKPLSASLPSQAIWLILWGGVAYSGGAVFYAWRGFRYHHMVWHLFVMAGTALHWYSVWRYVIPS